MLRAARLLLGPLACVLCFATDPARAQVLDQDSDGNGDGDAMRTSKRVAPSREPSQPEDESKAEVPRRWQLGVSLNLANYQRANFTVSPINSGRTFEGTMDRTGYGPSTSAVTLEPGYVFANGLVLGLLLDIGYRVTKLAVPGFGYSSETTTGSFAVGPRALYFFSDSGVLRPYALLAAGYTTTPGEETEQSIKLTEYQAFGGLGAHLFLDPAFSLDMSLRGAYGIGSGYLSNPPLEHAALEGTFYTAMWNLGTSGWLR